jgi:3-dehydroquinate synthetase
MVATFTVSYGVRHVRRHVFDIEETTLAEMVGGREVFVVADERVWQEYGTNIERYARGHLRLSGSARVSGQEHDKTLERVGDLCAAAFDHGLSRDGVFVGVGGGVTLDMAGFAAAIYRRGVRYLRIPTTLVGLIDVSVGIKQGINFHGKKSALGAFYPPMGSINDATFVSTLSRRHLSCGFAEILKVALVCDAALFELLEAAGRELYDSHLSSPVAAAEEVLFRAEAAMMRELEGNLFENDRRRLVDFGHTFSPLIEVASEYTIPHGEAVALDMLVSTALGAERGLCGWGVFGRLVECCRSFDLPMRYPLLLPTLLERALDDAKAHRGGDMNLVVPDGIGSGTFAQDVTGAELRAALRVVDAAAGR